MGKNSISPVSLLINANTPMSSPFFFFVFLDWIMSFADYIPSIATYMSLSSSSLFLFDSQCRISIRLSCFHTSFYFPLPFFYAIDTCSKSYTPHAHGQTPRVMHIATDLTLSPWSNHFKSVSIIVRNAQWSNRGIPPCSSCLLCIPVTSLFLYKL